MAAAEYLEGASRGAFAGAVNSKAGRKNNFYTLLGRGLRGSSASANGEARLQRGSSAVRTARLAFSVVLARSA